MENILNLIDSNTKESLNYKKVETWYDGTTMNNANVDGVVYRKKGNTYYRLVGSEKSLKTSLVNNVSPFKKACEIVDSVKDIKSIIIDRDYDLAGENITIPENIILDFQGGSLSNGDLNISNDVKIKGDPKLVDIESVGTVVSNEYLSKDTMAQMRGLSNLEIILLKIGYYKGVELHGYYEKGDTPAPIVYVLSDTNEEDDGGSFIIIESVRLKHEFVNVINTVYFGLNAAINSNPSETTQIIQNTFDCAYSNNVENTIINKGEHVIESTTTYRGANSNLTFEGILKLKNNDSTPENLTGCTLIRYIGYNIKVINQRLDGNRDNQTHRPQAGTQFNFTYYTYDDRGGITFDGGVSINSIQSHCQFVASQVKFNNYTFINSGEHAVYYSLNVNGEAGKLLQMDNCLIKNIGIINGGAGITTRAVRRGIYNNCTIDIGDQSLIGQTVCGTHYLAYRGNLLQEEEVFTHVYNSCIFKARQGRPNSIFTVNMRGDVNTPDSLTVRDHMKLGRGIYVYGGESDLYPGTGILLMEDHLLDMGYGTLFTVSWLPLKMNRCIIRNMYRYIPDSASDLTIESCHIYNSDFDYPNNTIPFDGNTIPQDSQGVLWNFTNNTFYDFKSHKVFGIIRMSVSQNINKLIVNGNKCINCDDAYLAYTGNFSNVVLTNNSDITNSNVGFRFTDSAIPNLVSNNDFIKEEGGITERPAVNRRFIGQRFYFTNIDKQQRWNGNDWETICKLQASRSEDSAIGVGEEYSQPQVQAILDELRDLKTKMRIAGLLET